MAKHRVSESLFFLFDKLVESVKSAVFCKIDVEQILPVGLSSGCEFESVLIGDVAFREFEEKKGIKEPFFMTVGIDMGHIGLQLLFSPFGAIGVAGIDKSQVGNFGIRAVICGVVVSGCAHVRNQQRSGESCK